MKKIIIACASVFLTAAGANAADVYNDNIVCNLNKTSSVWYEGDCWIPNQVNDLAVDFNGLFKGYKKPYFPDRRANARVKIGEDGRIVGTMQGRKVEDPRLFEIVRSRSGAIEFGKLPYGWFNAKLSRFDEKSINIVFDAGRQRAPSEEDLKVIDRAKEILSSEDKWSKKCTRKCSPNADEYSIFCAMMKAQGDVLSSVHYRQPAMQAFREVLNTVGKGRFDKHRIQDWNNHPDTTFTEVQDLLDQTRSRLELLMKK